MKLMIRRLRLLEKALMVSDDDEAEDGPAAIVRARRMRRLQMECQSITPRAFPPLPFQRNTTIAEVIRHMRYGPRHVRAESVL
jgi:hypothetical protein